MKFLTISVDRLKHSRVYILSDEEDEEKVSQLSLKSSKM
jgi:hypothetical protein